MAGQRYRILIVDDSREDREAYRRALARANEQEFDFLEAATGEEGLLLCHSAVPDCVILDHRLPDMDAVGFLASLCHGRLEPPVPVVVLTGQGNETVAVRALKAGAQDYLVKGAPEGEVQRAVRAAIEHHARPTDRTYRVLIIDDSPEDREVYRRQLLHGPGRYQFVEAEVGEEGIALCRSFSPDCVLLDYVLPDMDGLEVLAKLNAEHGRDTLAIVMLTGQGSEALAVRALKAGAEDYLVKGPALDGLAQAVRSAVEKVELRRKVDEQRREVERSRNELRVTLSSIGDAVISTDTDGRVTFLNHVAEKLTGWTSREASGRLLEEVFIILNEESRRPAENPAARALREGVIVGLANHTLLIAKDGAERPIDDSGAPIRDETGAVLGTVLVFRDVTERRRSEKTLRNQRDRARLLWEAAGILLRSENPEVMLRGLFAKISETLGLDAYFNFMVDDTRRNLRLQSCLGIPEEDVRRLTRLELGQAVSGTVALYQRSIVISHIQESDDPNIELLKRYGVRTYACYPLLANGRLLGTLSFGSRTRDELTQSELEFLETIANYVAVAYERIRLLTELRETDQRKNDFLAMLGHELRNPIAAVKHGLDLLRLPSVTDATRSSVREVLIEQTDHIVRLIDQLLDVSRVVRGKVEIHKERVELRAVLAEAIRMAQPLLDNGQCEVRTVFPAAAIWIDADPVRLKQVVGNLLNNAARYSGEQCRVEVIIEHLQSEAIIRVRDQGIGMDPGLIRRVFEPFVQGKRMLDRSEGGLGIGLTVVKSLVEMHGGRVEAFSEGEGKGSEFSIHLPLAGDVE